jgi:DNA polymerase-3 subunit epsilon
MPWVAIDFETANETRNSACALGVALVENGKIADRRSWLIRPPVLDFNPYNVMIHGITEADVASAPNFAAIWPDVQRFMRGHPLVAHNASFDMSVLRHCLDHYSIQYPNVQMFCTRLLAKRVWPDLASYSLSFIANKCGITFRHHDAEEDAAACAGVSLRCCDAIRATDLLAVAGTLGVLPGSLSPGEYEPCRVKPDSHSAKRFAPQTDAFDVDSHLFGTTVAFTGTLRSMVRNEAMQHVVNAGGQCATSVNRAVNILVVGDQDFSRFTDGQSSTKLRKAQQLRAVGADIEIISEHDFVGMLGPA